MKYTLQPGEAVTYSAQGRFIYVKAATGPLAFDVLTAEGRRSGYTLEKDDQVEFPARLASITIQNTHTLAQAIEVVEGEGIFHPNQDGQKVTLTGQDLSIEVVTQPGTPLEMESTDAKPVRVVNKTGTKIEVNGPLTDAQLRAAVLPVSGPLTNTQLRATPIDVQEALYPVATPGASMTGGGTIPANPDRKFLIVKAMKANTGIGWTGTTGNGDAIEAGERVIYETSGALTITATVPGDIFAFLEIEA